MNWHELTQELAPTLRTGQLEACIDRAAQVLRMQPESPFIKVLDLDFTNKPKDVATHIDNFISVEKNRINIKAVYAETNGFYINTDRWFFDVFAFESYEGHEDYDWLSDWQSDDFPEMTLSGMEELQGIYKKSLHIPDFEEAKHIASLLVVMKFQRLIQRAAHVMDELEVPLLATSHEFDFIYEYNPNP